MKESALGLLFRERGSELHGTIEPLLEIRFSSITARAEQPGAQPCRAARPGLRGAGAK